MGLQTWVFFFSSRRRHTRFDCDWSSDVCSSDLGTLFFNLAHYVVRPWPWIITALCSIIVFPELKDIQAAFPGADPNLIGHDSAFPAMLKFLPAGVVGLMVGGLIAANSSTILTPLDWGSS